MKNAEVVVERLKKVLKTRLSLKKILTRRLGKIAGLVVLALFLVFFGIYTWMNYSAGVELERELDEIRKSGAPVKLEEVVPPPVPDQENAAVIYSRAFGIIDMGTEEEQDALCEAEGRDNEWNKEKLKQNIRELRALTEKNKEFLGLLRQASTLRKCRFPLDWSKGFEMTLPHLMKMRFCARLLLTDAMIKYDGGKIEEAVNSCRISLRMGKHLSQEPLFVSYLVTMSIIHITLNGIQAVLREDDISSPVYESLLKELDDINLETSLKKAFEGERCGGVHIYKEVMEGRFSPEKIFGETSLYFSWICRPLFKKDMARYLRIMKEYIPLTTVPHYELKKTPEEFEREIANLPLYCFLTRSLMPALYRGYAKRAQCEAKIGTSQLALALRLYKAKNGSYPDSLEKLKGENLNEIPKDPFTGQDYIYKKEGEGFVVYSVGKDLKDDDGIVAKWVKGEGEYKGDIPWRSQK